MSSFVKRVVWCFGVAGFGMSLKSPKGELLGALTFLLGALIALLKAVMGSTISPIKIPGYKLNLLSLAG
jgi:hypothetical protein